jgi:hypothetical protein
MTKRKITTLTTLFCTACLCSGVSLATSNFNGSNGILLIPDVNVNGTTFYDSVTLQLDLNKGTFTVLNAKPKGISLSATPIDSFTAEGYTVGLLGCESSGTNEITCHMRVVNNEAERGLTVYSDQSGYGISLLFDDLNNAYKPASITFINEPSASYVFATLSQGVPANIKMVFKGIDIRAKSISAFTPKFSAGWNTNGAQFGVVFRNIKF